MRGQTRVTNIQAVVHEAGWWDAPLALRDSAKAIHIISGSDFWPRTIFRLPSPFIWTPPFIDIEVIFRTTAFIKTPPYYLELASTRYAYKYIFLLVTTKRHIYRKSECRGILTVYRDKHFTVWARVSDLRLCPSHFCWIWANLLILIKCQNFEINNIFEFFNLALHRKNFGPILKQKTRWWKTLASEWKIQRETERVSLLHWDIQQWKSDETSYNGSLPPQE